MKDSLNMTVDAGNNTMFSFELIAFIAFIIVAVLLYQFASPKIETVSDNRFQKFLFTYNYYIKFFLFLLFFIVFERSVSNYLSFNLEASAYLKLAVVLIFLFDPLRNIVAGFVLSQTKSLTTGETISVEGTLGTVENRGLIYVTLRTKLGNMYHIPNSKLLTLSFIHIKTKSVQDTVQFTFQVEANSSVDALEIARNAAFASPQIRVERTNQFLLEDYNSAKNEFTIKFDVTAKKASFTDQLKSDIIQNIIDYQRKQNDR
jgi:small-conductance mechanosensitive channel